MSNLPTIFTFVPLIKYSSKFSTVLLKIVIGTNVVFLFSPYPSFTANVNLPTIVSSDFLVYPLIIFTSISFVKFPHKITLFILSNSLLKTCYILLYYFYSVFVSKYLINFSLILFVNSL